MFDGPINWPNVLILCGFQTFTVVVLIVVKLVVVKRAVRREMNRAVDAVSKRLDASEIYLTAAEQHTAHQEEWEKRRAEEHERRRAEEHERRQQEYVNTLRKLVRDELARQLKVSESKVVQEVIKVPEATAEAVMQKSDPDSGLRRKVVAGTGDWHHG